MGLGFGLGSDASFMTHQLCPYARMSLCLYAATSLRLYVALSPRPLTCLWTCSDQGKSLATFSGVLMQDHQDGFPVQANPSLDPNPNRPPGQLSSVQVAWGRVEVRYPIVQ